MGLLLGMTVKSLERVAYFASYIIKSVDTEKRDKLLADKEAEFAAAKEAIKARYEKEAKAEGCRRQGSGRSPDQRDWKQLTTDFETFRDQIDGLEKLRPDERNRLPQPARRTASADNCRHGRRRAAGPARRNRP